MLTRTYTSSSEDGGSDRGQHGDRGGRVDGPGAVAAAVATVPAVSPVAAVGSQGALVRVLDEAAEVVLAVVRLLDAQVLIVVSERGKGNEGFNTCSWDPSLSRRILRGRGKNGYFKGKLSKERLENYYLRRN